MASEPRSCALGEDAYFNHPLQGVESINGQFPFLDLRESPSGGLYALVEGGRGNEDGSYEDLESGVVELSHYPITEEARLAVDALRPEEEESYAHDKFGSDLRLLLDEVDSGDLIDVEILAARPWDETVTLRVNRAIAEGRIETHSARENVRRQTLLDVAEETAAFLEPLRSWLDESGATLTFVGEYTTSIHATMPASLVRDLESRADVVRVDRPHEGAVMQGADGEEKAEALQHRLFWDEAYSCGVSTCNYDGENGTSTDIYVAAVDPEEFHEGHVAFKDTNAASSRIASKWNCNAACAAVPNGDWDPPEGPEGVHGTSLLGALLGDLRDGQDSGFPATSDREQRSSAGGEARAHLYEGSPSDLVTVMDHIPSLSPEPHFLVSSMGSSGSPTDWKDCNGDTTRAGEVDQFFENGFGLFQAAGNDLLDPDPVEQYWDTDGIDGSASNCTVWEPGDALGAFTVGAYDQETGDACEMRVALVWPESAWGGSATVFAEGRGRTIIDVLAPWSSERLASAASTTSYATAIGTSFANPTAASAAIAFIDMMKNLRSSNMIDDPGMLYAWMLNNADRSTGGFGKATSGYHQRTGAGKVNLRYVGLAGMDAPWYWYHWELCVPHNESVELSIAGGATLSSSIDQFRATAWWYDRRFKEGTPLDNVNMYLRKTDDTLLRASQSFTDNKERVYYNAVGGLAIKLVLDGFSVSADDEGCGDNAMRVWVTVLIEDDARNDSDGPDWDDNNCVGVEEL